MREKIVDLLEKTFEKQYDKNLVITAYSTANYLVAHDVVQVVRCKDCIHWEEREGVCLKIYSDGAVSPYAWQDRNPDDYCSYGERKNND